MAEKGAHAQLADFYSSVDRHTSRGFLWGVSFTAEEGELRNFIAITVFLTASIPAAWSEETNSNQQGHSNYLTSCETYDVDISVESSWYEVPDEAYQEAAATYDNEYDSIEYSVVSQNGYIVSHSMGSFLQEVSSDEEMFRFIGAGNVVFTICPYEGGGFENYFVQKRPSKTKKSGPEQIGLNNKPETSTTFSNAENALQRELFKIYPSHSVIAEYESGGHHYRELLWYDSVSNLSVVRGDATYSEAVDHPIPDQVSIQTYFGHRCTDQEVEDQTFTVEYEETIGWNYNMSRSVTSKEITDVKIKFRKGFFDGGISDTHEETINLRSGETHTGTIRERKTKKFVASIPPNSARLYLFEIRQSIASYPFTGNLVFEGSARKRHEIERDGIHWRSYHSRVALSSILPEAQRSLLISGHLSGVSKTTVVDKVYDRTLSAENCEYPHHLEPN